MSKELAQRSVNFYGDRLPVIRRDGIAYTPVKPICDALGVDWEAQRQRIERDDVLSSVACVLQVTGIDGNSYNMTCLPLEMLNGWLFGVSAGHICPENREHLRRYKLKCYQALAQAFNSTQVDLKLLKDVKSQLASLTAKVEALESASLEARRPRRYPSLPCKAEEGIPLRDRHYLILEALDHGPLSWGGLMTACGFPETRSSGVCRALSILQISGLVEKEIGHGTPYAITADGAAALRKHRRMVITTPDRPESPPMALVERAQWVVWRHFRSNRGEIRKVPMVPLAIHDGEIRPAKMARVSDPMSWSSYEDAVHTVNNRRYDGIGFVISSEDPFVVIDFDGCRDSETGMIAEWAIPWVNRLLPVAYIEISPSMTGLRAWVCGSASGAFTHSERCGRIEVYGYERFFAVTGLRVAGCADSPCDAQALVNEIKALAEESKAALDTPRS